jgi:hypothetical protein
MRGCAPMRELLSRYVDAMDEQQLLKQISGETS